MSSSGTYKPNAPELRDLQDIAESNGISQAEAIETYGWQNEFAKRVDRLREAYPSTFSSASLNPDSQFGAQINFVGKIPSDTKAFLRGAPFDIKVTNSASKSESQIASAVADVYSAAATLYDDPSAEYKESEAVVTLPVPSDSQSRATTVDAHAAIAAVVTKNGGAPDFSIQYTSAKRPGAVYVVVYGGGNLYNCTAGFTVGKGTQKGIITADHCPNSMKYEGSNVLTYRSRL